MIFILLILLVASMSAASRFSAASRLQLSMRHLDRSFLGLRDNPNYQVFISVKDSSALRSLREQGVQLNGIFPGFVTATVSQDNLRHISDINGVGMLSLAQRVHLCNDTSRYFTGVDGLHAASDLIVPIQGSGVIVGVIDCGIDFNHINLCDGNGVSRVRAVYLPTDTTGMSPVIKGNRLPGSCYETSQEIAALTTDFTGSSHGTHTTGTAAGSYLGNGWHGYAPEADIVVCGMPSDQLTDVNIANSVNYIYDYADRVGKPCVINMSIGSNEGPNDGTSFLCKTFEALSGSGHISVLSAGNDGHTPICFHQSIHHSSDTVTTLLRQQQGRPQFNGYVSMWSDRDVVHRSRLVVANRVTGDIIYASPFYGLLPDDTVMTISSEDDADFAALFLGEVTYAAAMEPQLVVGDGSTQPVRFHTYWVFDAESLDSERVLGLQYTSDDQVNLSGWCTNNTYFYTYGLAGVTGGTAAGSISDLVTTDSVISVGAYCSRRSYIDHNGIPYTYSLSHPGEMAYFSSYGPDENGIVRPDICAPGLGVISSANRYNDKANRQRWPASVFIDGMEYPYYANQGTSMSAPAVTGTVALMLQVNPLLTSSDVRSILRSSAIRDELVLTGDVDRWGAGKLDAAAAIDRTINLTCMPGDVNNDKEVNIADVLSLLDILLNRQNCPDPMTMLRADVNRDREIQLSDVNAIIDLILK
ncbi:MAG: S8 family serine peptidase [Muribaculaceae bacterium]|nr:S8 family serine peptidase [Muribaculaceae bacterium]